MLRKRGLLPMHCATCGKENSSDKKFCKYCGNSLIKEDKEDNNSNKNFKTISETSQISDQLEYEEEKVDNIEKSVSSTNNNSGGKDDSYRVFKYVMYILIAIIFLLVISIAVYLICTNRDDKNSSNSETVALEDVAEPAEETEEDFATNISDSTEEVIALEEIDVEDTAEETEAVAIEENEQEVYEAEEESVDEVMEVKKLPISYVEASSELNVKSVDNASYIAGNVADSDFKTAWIEGVEGRGEGQAIVLHLDGNHKIAGLKIYTGFLKTWARYVKNGKVTRVLVDYCNGQSQEVDLTYNWGLSEEDIDFDESTVETCSTVITTEQICETDTIKITIINAVAGSKYEDTAISEIEVYGY